MQTALVGVCILLSGHGYHARAQSLITFDDLSPGTGFVVIPQGYGGLQWFGFGVLNGSLQSTNGGYYNGRVSVPNVAFNLYSGAPSITYGSRFNLNSAYLTAESSNGLQIRIQGFAGDNLIYDQTNILTTSPSLVNFNYLQVDRVSFIPFTSSFFVLDNLSITSTNAPVANFVSFPISDPPLTIQFNDESVGAITNRDWDFGDGSAHSSAQDPWHTYGSDGPFSVTLKVLGSNGTTNSKTVVIMVGPTADFDFSPTWGKVPLAVQFTNNSKGSITNWDWDFGDGSAHSSTQNPSHTYTNPGSFDITLIVKNSYGATSSKIRGITADPPNGSTLITFEDLSPGAIPNGYRGILWTNFGVSNGTLQHTNEGLYNGIVSIPNVAVGGAASFTYGGPFDFNSAYVTAAFGNGLQLRAQGFAGTNLLYEKTNSLSMSAPTFIEFNFLQVDKVVFTTIPPGNAFVMDNMATTSRAHFSADTTSGQAPLTVQFLDQSIGTITNWDWNFGDGSAHSSFQNPSHEYTLIGSFNVILTVTVSNGFRYSSASRITTTAPSPACSTTASVPLAPGMVQGWGCNYAGQINTGCFSNIVAIAAGQNHSLLLTRDGTVVALGTITPGPLPVVPVVVPLGLSNVIAVAAGDVHSLALKSDGTVVAWGYNTYGQTSVPEDLTNVVAISAGANHSLALKADGTVVGWGTTTVPPGLSNIVAVSAGRGISMASRDDGTAVGWNLGRGADPSTLSNIVAISAGDNCCYEAGEALQSDGTLLVGSAFTNKWFVNGGGVVAISCSRGNDSHVSWGINAQGGVFAIGGFAFCGGPFLPPEGIYNAVAVASGDAHNLALIGDGPPVVRASLVNPSWDTNGFRASVQTQNGRVYRLEYKNSLTDSNWIGIPLVAGTGGLVTLRDPSATGEQRFYRVRRW